MQGLPSYGSTTGHSANAAAGGGQQQQQQQHHPHHQHHQENNSDSGFMAIAATSPTAPRVFATPNSADPLPSPIHNVPPPSLTSFDMAASMFSVVPPSSPKSFVSSSSFSVPLDMLPTSKPLNGEVSMTPAESPPNVSRKESDATATSSTTAAPTVAPSKRGYKSHVPSACINCKKAHLACDVSRPCKRCVALDKTDTCQDIKHKKRGRPRLRDKQTGNHPRDSGYQVMYGTIQTPTFSMTLPSTRPVAPCPPRNNRDPSLMVALTPSPSIAFIHESIGSFQEQQHNHPTPSISPQSHPTPNTIATPSGTNNAFLNTIPFSFEEVSFPESTSAIQQQYVAQPYPIAFPVNQQHQQQSYPSQPYHIIQQQHVPESASVQMKLDSTYGQQQQQQQRPTPVALAPSPSPQPAPPLLLQPNHHRHQPSYQHPDHHSTPQSPLPPPPPPPGPPPGRQRRQQEQQPSIAAPVEQHPVNYPGGYGNEDDDGRRGEPTATIVMSMEVCCARVSAEVTELWGYYPQEFAHRSFYDFISPKDTDRLARLHRLLLDNMVEMAQAVDPHYSPPDTERTTSDLFHNYSIKELMMVAPGSSSFSDTLHVKKRSGDVELYEIVACMGGAFGADLFNPASLSKVYIIGRLKKHEYKVSSRKYPFIEQPVTIPDANNIAFRQSLQSHGVMGPPSPPPVAAAPPNPDMNNFQHYHLQQRPSPPSVVTPAHTPVSSSTTPTFHQFNNNISHPDYRKPNISGSGGAGRVLRTAAASPAFRSPSSTAVSFSMPTRDTARTMGYQELCSTSGMSSSNTLPSRFKSSSHNHGSKIEPAKVNVAPISTHTKYKASMAAYPQKLSSNTLPSMFRQNNAPSTTPGAVYAGGPSAATAPPIGESSNPYSTLASYRLGSSTSSSSVTHPTTQYFLQTSSSTLNAAASAAQSITRQKGLYTSATDMADNDKAAGSTDSSRKVEMSILSLLC